MAGLIGEFGATAPGDVVDSVELNGLTWEVFAPEAELGLIMARADVADQTLVVVLAAPPDQLDELVGSVFQPVVAALEWHAS